MKKTLTLLSLLFVSVAGYAQPIIASGNPLTGINGDLYDSVAATGINMHGSVANSKDGKLFATNGGKLRYINPAHFSVIDSMDININYFVGWESNDTMFGLRTNGTLCRFNTLTKTLIDTVALSGQYQSRVVERPNSKEVWVSGNPMHVVDYTNAMTSTTTFTIGGGNINSLKASSDGLTVYAASGVTKRIYVIDAVAKVVTDSIDFAESPTAFELNANDSKVFVAATGKIRVYQTSNFDLIDSVNISMPTTTIYRHPSKSEMWCVHHFNDSVSVFDANTHAVIDSIPVGGSPFFLAFGQAGTSVEEINTTANIINAYPNPVTDILTITSAGTANLEIFNTQGSLVKTEKITDKAAISVAVLPAGMYYIRATDSKGRVQVLKFSKI